MHVPITVVNEQTVRASSESNSDTSQSVTLVPGHNDDAPAWYRASVTAAGTAL